MKYALILCSMVFAGLSVAEEEKATSALLDGKVFAGEVGKKGEEKSDKDTFDFKTGTFVSTACVAYGFKESPYEAKNADGVIEFMASPMNDKGEKMLWKGAVKGDSIEGTAVYETKDGKEDYWFKGKLK
jgi:hypothetical protein